MSRMNGKTIYKPSYQNSWALVIGINKYQHTGHLGFARQDAEALAATLTSLFHFPECNVITLFDENATRQNILSSFLNFGGDSVDADDRIVIFFAGHGCTRRGHRGEVGFLVPTDGNPNDLSTLVRWDELTRNAELIAAKHLLFVMDACYGGLAIHRSTSSGNSRFCMDMMQRYSRQVLLQAKQMKPLQIQVGQDLAIRFLQVTC